jgi:hypothetical protein
VFSAIGASSHSRKNFEIFKKVLTQFRVSRQKDALAVCMDTRTGNVKKQIYPSIKLHMLRSMLACRDKIMQRPSFPLIGLIVFGGVAFWLSAGWRFAGAEGHFCRFITTQCRDARDAGGVARKDRVSKRERTCRST